MGVNGKGTTICALKTVIVVKADIWINAELRVFCQIESTMNGDTLKVVNFSPWVVS
jgi:hypothetical protein